MLEFELYNKNCEINIDSGMRVPKQSLECFEVALSLKVGFLNSL